MQLVANEFPLKICFSYQQQLFCVEHQGPDQFHQIDRMGQGHISEWQI